MKSFPRIFLLSFIVLFLVTCKYDDYLAMPKNVEGFGILSLKDTGSSLASTIVIDTLDHRAMFKSCENESPTPLYGFKYSKLITFQGVQLINNNRFLFIGVKGALNAWTSNGNILTVESTLGQARILFDANLIPTVQYFDYSKRATFPRTYCEMNRAQKFNIADRQVVFIECPNDVEGFQYGWEKITIAEPKCYY